MLLTILIVVLMFWIVRGAQTTYVQDLVYREFYKSDDRPIVELCQLASDNPSMIYGTASVLLSYLHSRTGCMWIHSPGNCTWVNAFAVESCADYFADRHDYATAMDLLEITLRRWPDTQKYLIKHFPVWSKVPGHPIQSNWLSKLMYWSERSHDRPRYNRYKQMHEALF